MQRISEKQTVKEFEIPSNYVAVNICSNTNLIAGRGCPSYTEIYAPDTAPVTACNGEAHGRNYAEEIRQEQEAAERAAREAQERAARAAAEAAKKAEEARLEAEKKAREAAEKARQAANTASKAAAAPTPTQAQRP
jgi:hypothetical protein